MDQDATCYRGRDIVLDGDTATSIKKGTEPPPTLGRCLLCPNGWMDQDATWYGGSSRPRPLCVRWAPSYPQKKWHIHPVQFLAHVYCVQTAGWMKTRLDTKVDLGRAGHVVLDEVPALRERGTAAPRLFGPCLVWPRSPISATAELLL